MKKYINRNIVWAQFFVDHLVKLNVKNVVLSPGSRNTPLTYAFAKNEYIKKHIIVDERTSGFFALGLAIKTREPVVVVVTSGTAVAELYPAIIEAFQQRIPLVICTADRPPELHNCGEAQTINQNNIYRNHIRAYYNAGVAHVVKKSFAKFSNRIVKLLKTAMDIERGPVHFNLPFRKPFEPDIYTDKVNDKILLFANSLLDNLKENEVSKKDISEKDLDFVLEQIRTKKNGLIICGSGRYDSMFSEFLCKLASIIKYPIIADGLSPLRYGSHPKKMVVANSSAFFRSAEFKKNLRPEVIIHFGNAPTNKVLLDFFNFSDAIKISVNRDGDLKDPSQTITKIIKCDAISFVDKVASECKLINNSDDNNWTKTFKSLNKKSKQLKNDFLEQTSLEFEGKVSCELIKNIPEYSNLILSNSTPPRDIDFFANSSGKSISIFSNRGASGIDGLISTALGVSSCSNKSTFLLTGDLAFYYDINALQIGKKYNYSLTIILVDNEGGGIFRMLPIAKHKDIFDEYFNTKLNIDFEAIVKGFGAKYILVSDTEKFREEVSKEYKGIRVLHIKTNSQKSFELRKKYWSLVSSVTDKLLSVN